MTPGGADVRTKGWCEVMANDVIAIAAGIAGGLPPLHLPKRRERQPDPVAEAAAIAKRARRAAKRAEDERRTARGKWLSGNRAEEGIALAPDGEDVPSGFWDAVASGFTWDDYEAPLPQWKWRSRERRALPGMERPWFARYKGWRNLYTLIRRVGQGRFRALVLRGAL